VRSWPRQGEVWYVYFPGRPGDPRQPRPAIVVSENLRNRVRDHLIAVPIYSRGQVGPTRVALPSGAGGLRHDSVAFAEEIATVDRDFLAGDGPLGPPVPPDLLRAVVRAIRRAIGEVVPE
jgi:mRNA-degrading endonuclease toxin of MazEF toxin-antitoxin module